MRWLARLAVPLLAIAIASAAAAGERIRDFQVEVPASGDTLYYFRTVEGGKIYGIAN